MSKWLAVAAVAWPLGLGGAVWMQATGRASDWTTSVYLVASRVCHQRPDRSFHTAGVQWPVCGRCSGLYVGGALAALSLRRDARRRVPSLVFLVAAAPTMLTLAIEWSGAWAVSNAVRAVAATPLGAAVAVVIVGVAAEGRPKAIG